MTSSQALMQMHDPVGGVATNFDNLESKFTRITNRVSLVHDDLEAIRFQNGEAQFKGEAATKFSDEIAGIDNFIDDLGDITRQVAGIFGRHADQLRVLDGEVAAALARAQTAWNRQSTAAAERDEADSTIYWIQRQLDSLADEDGGVQRTELERSRTRHETIRWNADRSESDASGDLETERQCWRNLQSDERTLSEQTARELRNVHLGLLANPSWVEQRLDDIGGLIVAAWEGIVEHAADLFHSLYKILDWVVLGLFVLQFIFPVLVPLFVAATLLKAFIGVGLYNFTEGRVSAIDLLLDLVAVMGLPAARALGIRSIARGAGLLRKLSIESIQFISVSYEFSQTVGLTVEILRKGSELFLGGSEPVDRAISTLFLMGLKAHRALSPLPGAGLDLFPLPVLENPFRIPVPGFRPVLCPLQWEAA